MFVHSYDTFKLEVVLYLSLKHEVLHAGMLLLKQLWMPEMLSFAMSQLGHVILTMKTLPIVWRRLRRGWGSLWQGGCLLLFRESGKHQFDAGSLACDLVQATLGVSGAGAALDYVAIFLVTDLLRLALEGSLLLSIPVNNWKGGW